MVRFAYRFSIFSVLKTLLSSSLYALLFIASLTTLHSDPHFQHNQLETWKYALQAEELLRPASIVNSYGLFRRMTGVGGRPEVKSRIKTYF